MKNTEIHTITGATTKIGHYSAGTHSVPSKSIHHPRKLLRKRYTFHEQNIFLQIEDDLSYTIVDGSYKYKQNSTI